MATKEHASIAAEFRRLENGKYRGVVVQSLVGRFSIDEFEVHCALERNTEDEALKDAQNLAERRRQALFHSAHFHSAH
jgi:hypothetical protein